MMPLNIQPCPTTSTRPHSIECNKAKASVPNKTPRNEDDYTQQYYNSEDSNIQRQLVFNNQTTVIQMHEK